MPDICLFGSSEEWDPVSAFIRRFSNSAISHCGFYSVSQNQTYSAMADGHGLDWRTVKSSQKITLFDSDGMAAAFALALTWKGEGYDFRDIAGLLLGKNWQSADRIICDVTVFKAHRLSGNPLVNPDLYPEEHLTPRDMLLGNIWDHVQ